MEYKIGTRIEHFPRSTMAKGSISANDSISVTHILVSNCFFQGSQLGLGRRTVDVDSNVGKGLSMYQVDGIRRNIFFRANLELEI